MLLLQQFSAERHRFDGWLSYYSSSYRGLSVRIEVPKLFTSLQAHPTEITNVLKSGDRTTGSGQVLMVATSTTLRTAQDAVMCHSLEVNQ